MNQEKTESTPKKEWFAIRTRRESRAEKELAEKCDEVFFPKQTVAREGAKPRESAVIPHVIFVRTDRDTLTNLERQGREHPESVVPFWIYRHPGDNAVRSIPQSSIDLLRLLTADDSTRCEIFTKTDFKENQRVRVIAGPFEGYEGFVQRVKKNKHVVVRIEGICLVLLPFIHPDLL
ncbi:MAG: hypothetical protein K2K84_07925, partial [Muribaculaceae bacterium]|nr:hypothetical protein [Muribaculaceae bacterium]